LFELPRAAHQETSVKAECLSKLVLFGESSLQRAMTEFVAHYHLERKHQGQENSLLVPGPALMSVAASASVASFDIIPAPLESFAYTGPTHAVGYSLSVVRGVMATGN
jgi:hypothetical protein